MKQFAVYFIPNSSIFYKKGSELIGYDIINESLQKASENKYISLVQKLNSKSNKYGFHLTLTDVVGIDQSKLNKVVWRSRLIFSLPIFKNIEIERNKIGKMPNANVLAIQYHFNLKLFLLHLLLIIFVQRLGYRSSYTNNSNSLTSLQKIKNKLFLSPYIINDFLPHITLSQNFLELQQRELLKYMNFTFRDDKYLQIKQIAIVSRDSPNSNFKILEFIDN